MGYALVVLILALLGSSVSGHSCPNLTAHDVDLSPLQGTWDAVFFTGTEGSSTEWVPNFFNLSVCGPLEGSPCGASSSVCYSTGLHYFVNLGLHSSRQVTYASRAVAITYSFSGEAVATYGDGNVTINLICGRSLGVPQVVSGDPHDRQILIVWETSAACKMSTSRRYTKESKCYHVHMYEDDGLRANMVDLAGLIRPEGYVVKSSDGTRIRISVCKPLLTDSQHVFPSACSGTMACAQQSDSQALVLGAWSDSKEMQLHMHNGLLSVQYAMQNVSEDCSSESSATHTRTVRIHFICPKENQDLGPHIAFHDTSLCLVIISWYTSFACGNIAIQSTGCTLTTQGGLSFDLRGLSGRVDLPVITSTNQHYHYALQLCQGTFDDCEPPVIQGTRVVQKDGQVCRSLGTGSGFLRYADETLTLTYRNGDSCHSNFHRATQITFLCPDDIDGVSKNNSVRFMEEEDCFYVFEWVTDAACGAKDSGVANCQFEIPKMGLYDYAPLVGTQDASWVGISSDDSYKCFLVSPCGKLGVSEASYSSSVDYCKTRTGAVVKAPKECDGASVCAIMTDHVIAAGFFDLSQSSSIHAVDKNVVSVSGKYKNYTAVIHYVCKPGDLTTAPIFIGVIDQTIFEFHWKTFAACPKGLTSGSDCSVMYQGYLFNLASIPVLRFNTSDNAYMYEMSVCSQLPSSSKLCNDDPKVRAAACQFSRSTKKHYVLGQANSTLVYEDGVLRLTYSDGAQCHHISTPRNTTVLFICDETAHTASISSVTEDECTYVVEVRTKLACPAAIRASECTFHCDNHTYDFSSLSRSGVQGNWETRGRDGAEYLINMCQPLNFATGCHPLAGVCRVKSSRASLTYENLGMASNATFQFVSDDHGGHVQLVYYYTPPDIVTCPSWKTTIELYCSDLTSEAGPHFVSGGSVDAKCEYVFTWRSVAACPLHKEVQSTSCEVRTPSNFTFDLSPLSRRPNNLTQIGASEGSGFSFNISVCSSLPDPSCNNSQGVAVCQLDSTHKFHSCGKASTRQLTYFDDSLTLNYTGGDWCHHSKHNRSVLVTFECDRSASVSDTLPTYMNESECVYLFTWPTPLACLPQELDCVAAGGKYDLTPLLQRKKWEVESGLAGVTYVIGGCRSLDIREVPNCPQVPGMGACRYNTTGKSVLGYLTGNIVEEDEGVLRLEYHNGDPCPGGGKSMVHVHFTCGLGTREGVPSLAESSSTCHTHINWVTEYACSRLTNSSSSSSSSSSSAIERWDIVDPVTSVMVNLTALPKVLSRTYTAEDGTTYSYTVSLAEGHISCPTGHLNASNGAVGACQVKNSTQCTTNCVHVLGYRGTNSSSVSLVDGAVTAEYRNGDLCKHEANLWRQTTITFLCDPREDTFLEVLPEANCAYTFIVHTKHACVKDTPIGVECRVDGYQDLVAFQRQSWNRVANKDPTQEFFVSACDPLGKGVENCPSVAASCLHNKTSGKYINLGIPSSQYRPQSLGNQEGVVLQYVEGDLCQGDVRWRTKLLLVCNKNVPEGVPEIVTTSGCTAVVRWESVSACRTSLPYCPSSLTTCSMATCAGSEVNLDFTAFLQNKRLITSDNHGGSYAIQLCGKGTPSAPPIGCDPHNTGICRLSMGRGGASNVTVVYANHTIAVVSHSPRVIDVTFHSGTTCPMNQNRNYTAIVHMVCSRTEETSVPKLVSDTDCELHFDWRNATFCAGESVSGGCAAAGSRGYVYSLDAMISQKWTGVVSPSKASSALGTFSLAICRNLNPFSSSGLHCSSPSAICWHTTDGRHINLGRPSSAPRVVTEKGNYTEILIEYSHGDLCNSHTKEQYRTNLFVHCSNTTTSPVLTRNDKAGGNCSWIISMTSPQACKYVTDNNSTSCFIRTASGAFNFSDLAQKPLQFSGKDVRVRYTVCLCGGSSCGSPGITMISNGTKVNLGKFTSLSVPTSTGGPRLAYYKGDICYKSTRYQSWLLMECSRHTSTGGTNTLIETDPSATCSKVFLWYTPRACHSKDVSCSVLTESHYLYDFSLLRSADRPWIVISPYAKFYINICGEIDEFLDAGMHSCGNDVSICMKSGGKFTAIGLTNTQQISVANQVVKISYTGVASADKSLCRATIVMECAGIYDLEFDRRVGSTCEYIFRWRTPHACKLQEKPQVYQHCSDVSSSAKTGPFVFDPSKISSRTWRDIRRGTFHMKLCGKSENCDGDDSVCVSSSSSGTKIGIASFSHSSIVVDGEQLLFQMNGSSNSHAIIRVVCLLKDDRNYASLENQAVLDNVVENSSHIYYYFTLYAEQGQGCEFINPAATAASTTTSTAAAIDHSKGRHSVIGAVVVVISLAVVVTIFVLVAIFYRKSRRDRLKKAFVYLTVGKSSEPVRYHKITSKEKESLLNNDSSDSDDNSEEIPLQPRGESRAGDKETDEELINL